MKDLNINISYLIRKPVKQVFDSVCDSQKLSGYFISAASDDIRTPGTIMWEWGDVGVAMSIQILEVLSEEKIVFKWSASGKEAKVEMEFKSVDDQTTLFSVREGPFKADEKEIPMAIQQTQGWTDFICSLKAYIHSGVNLRKL